MNAALCADALFAKSQVYVQRGLRAQAEANNEEYQLWASLALELLGKAVLAKVHPTLIADPQHYQSLFAACGKVISPDIKTITAKTVFKRLTHLNREFDSRRQHYCEQLSLRRNAELHSGESPFSGAKPDAWERDFWGVINVLLQEFESDLDSWLGADGAEAPKAIVEQSIQKLGLAIQDRIARSKQDLEVKYKDPKQREKVIAAAETCAWWERKPFYISYDDTERAACPACGAKGVLAGSLWHEEVIDEVADEESWSEVVESTYVTEEYYCPACELHLVGVAEVGSAGLSEEFQRTDERERQFEQEYNNE